MESGTERIVPMRLVANWETDRASTSAVQRMFTMALSRMAFNFVEDQQYSFVITVKLLGIKRTLRSNDIQATTSGGRLDIPLNIFFVIQYPHFLKKKGNVLQILLQRRKRYKNRQIPGYKTLALGSVNLSEVLQNGNLKEILLFDPDYEKEERPSSSPVGRILVSSCQSLALELENEVNAQRLKEKEVESEEEEGTSSEAQDSDNEQDNASDSGRKHRLKMRNNRDRKWAQRKNLKQKFVSLLKKFKVSEEDGVGSTSRVENGPSTAKQLEELFEELEGLSDSGPEMVGDNLSIISNPRPGLTPYFPTASREVLPRIKDRRSDESDEEWSSELENVTENFDPSSGMTGPTLSKTVTIKNDVAKSEVNNLPPAQFSEAKNMHTSNEIREPTPIGIPSAAPSHYTEPSQSSTARTYGINYDVRGNTPPFSEVVTFVSSADVSQLDVKPQFRKLKAQMLEEISPRSTTFSERLSATFRDVETWPFSVRMCICSLASLPILSSLEPFYKLIDCTTFNECRMLISTIVAKIQRFCNNSSETPPSTTLFVIGYEKLINNVLRAYVESLQAKSAEWINFLRFCVVPPPKSSLGNLIGLCSDSQWYPKELFERTGNEVTPDELKNKVDAFANGNVIRLPIGEAMLQLYKKTTGDDTDSQIFVPFLAEVKVGQLDEDSETYIVNRCQEEVQNNFVQSVASPSHASPPLSPHGSQRTSDSQELQIEYWVTPLSVSESGNSGNLIGNAGISPMNSGSKRDAQLIKNSIRSTFRSFSILRKKSTDALSLNFIKEKKKEKMFQKLGMKKGQKSDLESPVITNYVGKVTRLICSGKHPLSLSIDGTLWTGVRFFQASMQWQTHVKHFPICLPSEEQIRRY